MAIPTVSGSAHSNSSGASTTLAFSATVTAGDQLLVIVQVLSGSILDTSLLMSSVTYGSQSLTRIAKRTTFNHDHEVWVHTSPTAGSATVTVTSPSSLKLSASAHSIEGARNLLLAGSVATNASSPLPSAADTSTNASGQVNSASTSEDSLGLFQCASTINNQTFAIVGGANTSLFEDDTVATTDIHLACCRGTVPPGGTGWTAAFTLGTTDSWGAITVAVAAGATATPGTTIKVLSQRFIAPSAATPSAVTPNGSAWVNSTWVQLLAATDADSALAALHIIDPGHAEVSAEVDVGVGGAGSEVVIATFRLWVGFNFVSLSALNVPCPILIDAIPNGSRIAVRLRQEGTNTTTWKLAVSYYKKSVSGISTPATTAPIKISPSAATGVSVTIGNVSGAWNNPASFTQITASTSAAWILLGFVTPNDVGTSHEFELDIAIGAAASEVVITTVRAVRKGFGPGGPGFYEIKPPLDAIPSGARVSARARWSRASADTMLISAVYIQKP